MAIERPRFSAVAGSADDLFARRVRAIYANATVVLVAPGLNAILLVAFFWSVAPRGRLLAWLIANLVLATVRYVLAIRYRAAAPSPSEARRWAVRFLAGLYVAGVAFGSAGVLLFPESSPGHQALLAFLMGGMIAGAAGAYNALRRAFIPYMVLVGLPISIRLLAVGDPICTAMALMTLVFLLLMTAAGWQMNRIATGSLVLEEENQLLRVQKLEAVGALAGGLAHDFNNLLAGILGNVTLAKLDPGVPTDVRERLEEAESVAIRARGLTNQLLTFSKGGTPRRTPLDAAELIRRAVRFAMSGSSHRVRVSIADDLRPISADAGQIAQVLRNLLANAQESMASGGTVSVSCRNLDLEEAGPLSAADSYVELTVCDEGTGVSEEHRARVFEPWFSTREGSSGLGLTAVQWIVRGHEGHIDIENRPEGGARVRILLPAAEGDVPAPRGRSGESPPGSRILVMDDDPVVRDVVRAMLERLGHEVVSAADGAEAIRLFEEARREGRPFGAVLLDLTVVGGKGGRETMRLLREIDPEVRGIISSGYSDDETMADPERFGFTDLIAKPFRLEELDEVLRRVLSAR